jgi:hypothetical protein
MGIELLLHSGVGGAPGELCPQLIGLQQVATPTVGNNVGDRFAAYGEGYPITGPYGINDTSGPIAEVTTPISMCDSGAPVIVTEGLSSYQDARAVGISGPRTYRHERMPILPVVRWAPMGKCQHA